MSTYPHLTHFLLQALENEVRDSVVRLTPHVSFEVPIVFNDNAVFDSCYSINYMLRWDDSRNVGSRNF